MQKKIATPLLVVLSLAQSISSAQSFPPGFHSLDTPFDARSIAVGESFVAVRGNRHALTYNPAGISGIEGLSVSFSRRNFNYSDIASDWKYIVFTGTFSSPIADFGIVYNRFHIGEFVITTPESPDEVGRGKLSDYLLGLSAGIEIMNGIEAGLQVKTFRPVLELTAGSYQLPTFNNPLLLDLGVIGSIDGQFTNTSIGYSLAGGIAVQNYGTDMRTEEPPSTSQWRPVKRYLSLPRTLRTGIAFSISTPQFPELGVSPLSILITGEYRLIVNSRLSPKENFWGFGAELTVLEIFTGRIGGFMPSHSSIYGVKGSPSLRSGAGVRVPLGLMGLREPISLRVDYAAIPLNTQIPFFRFLNTTLHAFSLNVVYENDLLSSTD